MLRRAEEAFGGVDVLVNVAGVMLPAPIVEADPADWRRMVEVKLMGVLHATRAALPNVLERGNGRIVNVGHWRTRAQIQPDRCFAPTLRSVARYARRQYNGDRPGKRRTRREAGAQSRGPPDREAAGPPKE